MDGLLQSPLHRCARLKIYAQIVLKHLVKRLSVKTEDTKYIELRLWWRSQFNSFSGSARCRMTRGKRARHHYRWIAWVIA